MDLNLKGNPSAINYWTPPLRKMKGYGNFADSNTKAVKTQTKKQVRRSRAGGKKRPLKYSQNFGQKNG